MKIIKTLVIICCVSLLGCENPTENQSDTLVGKWNFTERIVYNNEGKEIAVYKEDNFYCPLDFYTFFNNEKIEFTDYKPHYDYDQICTGLVYRGTWVLSQFSLTINYENLPKVNYTIVKITANELELEQPVPLDVAEIFDGNATTQKLIFKR